MRYVNPHLLGFIVGCGILFFVFSGSALGSTCLMGDCDNGRGAAVFEDGTKYTGEFKDGQPHGKGTFEYPKGKRLDLNKDVEYGGKTFVKSLPYGKKYVGDVKSGVRHGRGDLTYNSGAHYVGEFKDDMLNGKGVMENPSGIVYEGEFVDGQPHGKGRVTFPDGKVYTGDVQRNQITGYGTMTFPDGRSVNAYFENGKQTTPPENDQPEAPIDITD